MSEKSRKPATVSCPTCGTQVEWTPRSRYRPFCSERCKLIDLGDWLDGSNSIPGPELDDESVHGLSGGRDGAANDEG